MPASSDFPTSNQYINYDIVVTENSTSIANNTSSVTVKVRAWRTNTGYTTYGEGTCYCEINGTSYSQGINTSQKLTYNSDTVLFSQTVTIPHNADGSKSIYVEAKISHSRFSSDWNGFTVALSQIPRQATLTAVQNFNDEQNPTITYSNPAGNAVSSLQACISLTGSRADVPYRDISKTGSSYTFNLTSAERTTLRNASPNSNTLNVIFYVKTVIAGQTYYSTKNATMSIVNGNPTISGVTYKDNNASSVAVSQNNQIIIQNQSQLLFNFSTLTALKSATLTKIEVTINSVTKSMSLSGASKSNVSLIFGLVNTSSNTNASIKLTDSRGNTTTVSKSITIQAWIAPSAIITCQRKNNYYSDTNLYVNADFSSLGGKNSITITYYYKLTTASSWTTGGTMSDESTVTIDLDNTKEWNIKVTVTDVFATTTYLLAVDKGIPIIYFDRLLRAVGVNCFPDEEGSFATDGLFSLSELGLYGFCCGSIQASAGYLRIASIEITSNYANAPIEFETFQRGIVRPVRLFMAFANANHTDPDLASLKYDWTSGATNFEAIAVKTASSKWDVYVKKTESYDAVSVKVTVPLYMRQRIKLTFDEDFQATAPAGAITATSL